MLSAAGFEVIEAGTGREALAKSKGGADLIILDVNLPDIDGFEVCRILRSEPVTARTPVIHLSATFVKDVHKVKGLEAGADGYLTHPVEPPVLIATVNAFLRARQAEDAMRTSEARFKAVFENALNGIALLSDGMIYLDVNPAVCSMLGRERDEIVGRHISAFLPGDSEQNPGRRRSRPGRVRDLARQFPGGPRVRQRAASRLEHRGSLRAGDAAGRDDRHFGTQGHRGRA